MPYRRIERRPRSRRVGKGTRRVVCGADVRHSATHTERLEAKLVWVGCTITEFEHVYHNALRVEASPWAEGILLVDAASTRVSTLTQATRVLREHQPKMVIVVAAAVQMIVNDVVVDDNGFRTQMA